ncbi:hypothetical protein BuS5_03392 [Desulfosarcina sp. BuS5]|uniref:hypothetical protein n=1 Tax=Desulfosarcina sp. BuS5 TaxID=933262 RepID=UPI0004884040|nr:hypothetical protein [Desulfosarcina sp. BuS5]WDN90421.1 hypothetical protein BuS5_03392 [Desulfosarcina sp. BuS5]
MQWRKTDFKQIINDRRMIILIGMVVLCLGYVALQKHINIKAEKNFNHTIAGIKSYADIHYNDIFVDPISRKVYIKHITITPKNSLESLNIGELILYQCDVKNKIPHTLHFAIKDFEICQDNSTLLKLRPYFDELRYSELKVDFDLEYRVENKDDSLVINKMVIDAENVGRAEFYLKLNRFNLTRLLNPSDSAGNLSRTLPFVSISEASLNYADDSFVLRFLERLARQGNRPVEYLIHDISEELQKKIGDSNEFTRIQLQALIEFINNPDKIKITAYPEKPVPLANFLWLNDLNDLIDLLRIRIN